MYKDKIVKLDNGLEIYVIDEMTFAGRTFILGAQVDVARDQIDEEDLIFKEVIKEDGVDKFVGIENMSEAQSYLQMMLMKIRDEE